MKTKKSTWALISLLSILSLIFGAGVTGCKTGSAGTPATVDTNVVNQVAVVFRGAARASALIAIQKDPASRQWFSLAQAAIGQFVAGAKHDPQAFKAALAKLPKMDEAWTALVVGSVVDAYEIYYLKYSAPIKDSTAAGWVACRFLAAVQEGFSDAVENRPMLSPDKPKTLAQAKEWLGGLK